MPKGCLSKEVGRLHQIFPVAQSPMMSKHVGDSGKERLPFNRKKPPVEPGSVWAAMCEISGKRPPASVPVVISMETKYFVKEITTADSS